MTHVRNDRVLSRRQGALERINKRIAFLEDLSKKEEGWNRVGLEGLKELTTLISRSKEEQKVLQVRTDPQWVPTKKARRVKTKKVQE